MTQRPVQPRGSSKIDRLCRLEQSALLLFSRRGYDGTALRDITDHAGVPLSLIDRHFGHKSQLFHEIHMRVWRALNKERNALLAEFGRGGALTVDAVILAFVRPVVALALQSPEGRAAVRLVREGRTLMVHHDIGHSTERNAVRQIWIDALMAARPDLSPVDAVWAFSLIVNAAYSHQLLDNWLDHLMPPEPEGTVDEVSARIVAFCAAGVGALTRR